MISFLQGKIAQKLPTAIIVETNGMGFHVNVNNSALANAGSVGDTIKLHTHLMYAERDSTFNLYGFLTKEEYGLFRQLISVSGVGAKSALALLSQMSVADFSLALISQDAKAIAKAPGLGIKTAQKIIIELKDKIKDDELLTQISGASQQAVYSGEPSFIQDAIEAMIALGYPPAEAAKAVNAVKDEGKTADELIRMALRRFSF
ncbi:MAG: Holliday junction branch migration protein RuvA [Christensenellales bacterium]|jgi:Holliday junction DNA helicase RuvA